MRNGERPKLNRNDYVFFTKKRIKKLLESKYTKRQSKVSALSLSHDSLIQVISLRSGRFRGKPPRDTHTHRTHTQNNFFFISYCDKTLKRDSRKHGWDYTILDKMELSGKMNLKYECHIDRKYSSQHWGGTPLNFPITQPNVQEKKTKSQNVKSVKRPSLFSKPPTVSFGFTHRDAQS